MDKKQYEKMCAELDSSNMYDGRGTIDLYTCRYCGCQKLSIYKDKGVTPFSIKCKCGEIMTHERTFREIIEWRRPLFSEFNALSESMQEHVKMGGLIQ